MDKSTFHISLDVDQILSLVVVGAEQVIHRPGPSSKDFHQAQDSLTAEMEISSNNYALTARLYRFDGIRQKQEGPPDFAIRYLFELSNNVHCFSHIWTSINSQRDELIKGYALETFRRAALLTGNTVGYELKLNPNPAFTKPE